MITGTTIDYTGRTKDLFISQGIDPLSSSIQSVTYSFGTISSFIAGVQKLVQRYAIALINNGLLNNIRAASANNLQVATHIFNFASYAVVSSFQAYALANPGAPNDETIASATLTDISSGNGSLSLTVQLVTNAGSSVVFVLPLSL